MPEPVQELPVSTLGTQAIFEHVPAVERQVFPPVEAPVQAFPLLAACCVHVPAWQRKTEQVLVPGTKSLTYENNRRKTK